MHDFCLKSMKPKGMFDVILCSDLTVGFFAQPEKNKLELPGFSVMYFYMLYCNVQYMCMVTQLW